MWKIHLRILKGRQCGDDDISRAAIEMLHKFDKYWREYVMVLAFGVIGEIYELNLLNYTGSTKSLLKLEILI